MDFFDVIHKRYSVRSYKKDKADPEIFRKLEQAAVIAPTAGNRQPFKLLAINTDGRKEELRKIYNREWFITAPHLFCICSVPEKGWVRSDGKNYSDIDAAIVMDHLILSATALGLGTCWVAAFDVGEAKEVLRLEAGLEPVAFAAVGYANDTIREKNRKPLEELIVEK